MLGADRRRDAGDRPEQASDADPGSSRAIARVTASRYATMAVSLVVGVVLARSLDPAGRGAYAVALTLTAVPAIVAGAGLETAALRTVDDGQRADVFRYIARRVLAVAAVVLALVVAVLVSRVGLLGLTVPQLVVSLASIPAVVAVQLYGNAILGLRRWRTWVTATLSNALTYVVTVSVVAVTGSASVVAYQLAFLAGYLTALACVVGVIRAHSHGLRVDTTSAVAHTASHTRFITISQALFMRIQVPLLQVLSGTAAVGVLAVASPVSDLLLVLPVAAGTVLLPQYYSSVTAPAAVRRSALRVLALTAAAGVLTAALAPWLVPLLYGPDYAEAALILQIMVPGVVLFSYARVVQSYLISCSRYARVLLASLLSVVVSVLVQMAASPSLGAVGGGLAVSAGFLTLFAVICSAALRDEVAE